MSSVLLPFGGGLLIGLAATLLLLINGRIAGISGIAGGLLVPCRGDRAWRVLFLAGLVGGGLLLAATQRTGSTTAAVGASGVAVVAGLLVGFGTRLGNGCTSGHGVCGLARGAPRSLAATVTFIASGALTVFVARHLLGGIS